MRCDPYKNVGYFFDRGGFILVPEIEIMLFKGLFINFKGISFHDGILLKGFVAFVCFCCSCEKCEWIQHLKCQIRTNKPTPTVGLMFDGLSFSFSEVISWHSFKSAVHEGVLIV